MVYHMHTTQKSRFNHPVLAVMQVVVIEWRASPGNCGCKVTGIFSPGSPLVQIPDHRLLIPHLAESMILAGCLNAMTCFSNPFVI
jgi:hypothetical protein